MGTSRPSEVRVDELRSALHDAGWDVIEETEPTDAHDGWWVIQHHFLPVAQRRLIFQTMDGWGHSAPIAAAYGCKVEGSPELDLYLSGNRAERRKQIAAFVADLTQHARDEHRPPAAPTGPADLYTINLRNISSPRGLFLTISRQLRFPDYFGHNWNALDDCMRDLAWIPAAHVVVEFKHLPVLAEQSPQLHATLVESLDMWRDHWSTSRDRLVEIVSD